MEQHIVITLSIAELKDLIKEAVNECLKKQQSTLIKELGKDSDAWMSIEELIEYMPGRFTKGMIYMKVSRDDIPYRKDGKRLVFLRSEIDNWLKNK